MKPLEMNPVCEHDQTEQRKCHSALPFLLITVVDLVVFSSMYCILQGLDKGPATICAFRNYILASKCIGAPDPLHCCARFMSPATCDMQFTALVASILACVPSQSAALY